MKVLAILQNQWFANQVSARAMFKRWPERREHLIRYCLFAGCRTGRVLKDALGEEWCRKIVWEEASPEVGGVASSVFPADPAHLRAVVDKVKPDVVVALGKVAANGIAALELPLAKQYFGPHPTARGVDAGEWLRGLRVVLDNYKQNWPA